MEDWRELARLVYRYLGLAIVIVGAAYDKSYSDQVLASETLSDILILDRVGQWDIHENSTAGRETGWHAGALSRPGPDAHKAVRTGARAAGGRSLPCRLLGDVAVHFGSHSHVLAKECGEIALVCPADLRANRTERQIRLSQQ